MRSAAGASRTRSTRSPIGHFEGARSIAGVLRGRRGGRRIGAAEDYPAPDPAKAAEWREAQANRQARAEAGVGQLAEQVVSEYH